MHGSMVDIQSPTAEIRRIWFPPKQPFWDRPGILADQALVRSSLTTPSQSALFLAASSPHSGDWLFALPIASCGLRLDDEAVRVGVGLRLGLPLCVPHQCSCGSLVDTSGLCRSARPHALNDLIARAVPSAGIPATGVCHDHTENVRTASR